MHYQLEVCSFNIQSCVIAQAAGAARIELCDNPADGGTTPSYGTIKAVKEKVTIPVYPIIRPRGGNFFYSNEEWQIMQADIIMCKQLGCDGISIGIQKQNGDLDTDAMKRIAALAYPMGVTCHRVFDRVPDPFAAVEALINCGCERILTSGQEATAIDGAILLQQLVAHAANRISIMPGAGVREHNLAALITATGAYEFHTSAKKIMTDNVVFKNNNVSDAGYWYMADEGVLKEMVAILKSQATNNNS
jgi:copper homeostasis protein